MTPLVVCIKVGTKYGPEYVNNLHAMVERHLTRAHKFLCLTDDPKGVNARTEDIDTDLEGWWAKLILFKPHDALVNRRVLFLDLDTIIVDNMDFLLEYQGPFAILRDFYRPKEWGSAIMSIAPGYGAQIWSHFPGVALYWGDQAWIQKHLQTADHWQDLYPDKIVSYKVHCQQGIPEGAAVVCFHGKPRPAEVRELPFMQEHWHDCPPVAR